MVKIVILSLLGFLIKSFKYVLLTSKFMTVNYVQVFCDFNFDYTKYTIKS